MSTSVGRQVQGRVGRGYNSGYMQAQSLIRQVDETFPPVPFARPGGSLLVMVGLPGAGKSSVVGVLQHYLPCTVVTTDLVRQLVRDKAQYTASEMAFVYEVCYGVVQRRLEAGTRVVFDGSNYLSARRQQLYRIAEAKKAVLAICHVQASEMVTRARLGQRMSGKREDGDYSEAGWAVYQWMVETQEPIAEPHLTLDSTGSPPEELGKQLYHYWMQQERHHQVEKDR